jgi:hypothetical protein
MVAWLEGLAMVLGRGGKKAIAERLDITPDVLSHILRRRSGFDPKTVRLLNWINTSKAEDYLECPVRKTVKVDTLEFELREMDDGTEEWTWRRAES